MNKWVTMEANKENVSYEEAKARMDEICSKYDVTYRDIYKKKLYAKNDIRIRRILSKRANKEDVYIERLQEEAGMTKAEADKFIEYWHKKTGVKFIYGRILDSKIYEMSDEEIYDFAAKIKRHNELFDQIRIEANSAYLEHRSITEYQDMINEAMGLLSQTITESNRNGTINMLESALIDPSQFTEEEIEQITVDKLFMRRVFMYSGTDYTAYDMMHKSMDERLEYLTHGEKNKYIGRINDSTVVEILDSKLEAYKKFKDSYKRDVLYIDDSEEAMQAFKEFCTKHSSFIFKPLAESKGKGVKKVDVPADVEWDSFFEEMMEDYEDAILEELIIQNEAMGRFNPDCVNTIRVVTITRDGKTTCKWPIIRVGRSGQIIDNASAGGLFAAIDAETGTLISDGFDYTGSTYEEHPDTHIRFKGAQIPKWDELIDSCVNNAKSIPEVNYIGWDLTLNNDGEWVIVEVNQSPGCRAFQVATGNGIRRDFLEQLGIDEAEIDNIRGTAVPYVEDRSLKRRIKRLIRRIIK